MHTCKFLAFGGKTIIYQEFFFFNLKSYSHLLYIDFKFSLKNHINLFVCLFWDEFVLPIVILDLQIILQYYVNDINTDEVQILKSGGGNSRKWISSMKFHFNFCTNCLNIFQIIFFLFSTNKYLTISFFLLISSPTYSLPSSCAFGIDESWQLMGFIFGGMGGWVSLFLGLVVMVFVG